MIHRQFSSRRTTSPCGGRKRRRGFLREDYHQSQQQGICLFYRLKSRRVTDCEILFLNFIWLYFSLLKLATKARSLPFVPWREVLDIAKGALVNFAFAPLLHAPDQKSFNGRFKHWNPDFAHTPRNLYVITFIIAFEGWRVRIFKLQLRHQHMQNRSPALSQ